MKKISVILIICAASFAAQNHITIPPDAEVNTGHAIPYTGYRQSPGIEVGITDNDYSCSEGARWIFCSPSGAYHFCWSYRFGSSNSYLRPYYNFYDPPSYWLGPTSMDLTRARIGAMDQLSDGRAVGTAHASTTSSIIPRIYIDSAEGAGTFTSIDIPWAGNPINMPIWPRICVDDSDYIYIAASQSGGPYGWWTMSTDEGQTWMPWDSSMGGVDLNVLNYDYGGHERWTQYGNIIALINNMGDDYYTIVYWESTDQGATWSYDTVYCFETTPGDSVQGYLWNSGVYDNNGYLHVVFTCLDTVISGGSSGSGWRSLVRHWNQQTDQVSLVASGWWGINPGPGANHPTVSECKIAINRATGTLYCTWCQADSGNAAANGNTNLEIYGAYSTDNGTSWSERHNITNSPSPGADSGFCDNDCVQSINEEVRNDTVYLFYLNDKDGGFASLLTPNASVTDSPMLFYACYFPVGIEEAKTQEPMQPMLSITPNPVSNQAVITYALPALGNHTMKLFDMCGRSLKTIDSGRKPSGHYTTNLNLAGLSNGTYFVVLETENSEHSVAFTLIR